MFHNYLLFAWRNLLKNRAFSLINVFGLATGMAAVLMIYLFIRREGSYDRFHEQGDRIYRVYQTGSSSDEDAKGAAYVPAVLARTLGEELPEVEAAVRLLDLGHNARPIIRYGDQSFNESRVFLADSNFARISTVRFVKGNPATALLHPRSVVFTEETAEKYFGPDEPLGKVVQLAGDPFTVTGVVEAFPSASHFRFDVLNSMSTSKASRSTWWLDNAYLTYVLLRPDARPAGLQPKIDSITHKHMNPQYQHVMKKTFSELVREGKGFQYALQPLPAIRLHSAHIFDFTPQGNIVYVYLFAGIGLLILLIACFNYINLTTASAAARAREVGVRKVLGSRRADLLAQFFLEGLLINGVALVLAFTVVQCRLPGFNRLSGQSLAFTLWRESGFWAALLPGLCLGAFLSGLYPALVLSAYRPVQVLKGQLRRTTGGITFRQALVCFQFAASIALVAGTFAIYRQVSYMRSKHPGLDISQTLVVPASRERRANQEENERFDRKDSLFRREVGLVAGVAGVTAASTVPGKPVDWASRYFPSTSAPDREAVYYDTYSVGYEFLDQFKVRVIAGQAIAPHRKQLMQASATEPVMLNEAAVKAMGFPNSAAAVGHVFYSRNGMGRNFPLEVTGVIANFHQGSLREAYKPGIFRVGGAAGAVAYYAIKVDTRNLPRTVRQVEATFKGLFPGSPFEYFFLDDHFAAQYRDDQQFGRVFGLFAGLTIFVACLGLFGLSVLAAQGRRKEIGVRKILGASVPSLVRLLAGDFVRVVLAANVAAWPLAYWGIREWLAGYAFRIEINAWLFVLPTGLVLLVALLTVSAQTWRAARANPVSSLRSE